MIKWSSWISEAMDLMDGDGAFTISISERQAASAYDMGVLRFIRGEWVRLKNEEMKRSVR
jgi:hypothetical protein